VLDVVNPSSDQNIKHFNENLHTYDGLIWGGSSLNIYNDTPEIRKQIEFMKNCQNKVKNILAICWGMQVAVTAAGGQVKKADISHIGIAKEIEINKNGLNHPIYKGKDTKFNSPAFNFDEVVKLPEKGICLASNKVNKVQSLYFEINNTKVWGLQYHPEITYEKMINLIEFRKKKLIEIRKVFKNENDIDNHISFIKNEILITDKKIKMLELQNWLNQLN
jgi:GMP synthase (glutamine-hydrolysing)